MTIEEGAHPPARSWRHRGALPAAELLHPTVLLAMAVLALNDHVLKSMWPGWVTWKLSDFAGVYFFPFLMTAGWNTARLLARRPVTSLTLRQARVAAGVTAAGFILVKTWAPAAAGWTALLGACGFPSGVSMDPTDLAALIMLVPALLRFHREIDGTGKLPAWT